MKKSTKHLLMGGLVIACVCASGCSSNGFFRNREMDYTRQPVVMHPIPQTPHALSQPNLIPVYPIPEGVLDYPVTHLPDLSPSLGAGGVNAFSQDTQSASLVWTGSVKMTLLRDPKGVPYLEISAPQSSVLKGLEQRKAHLTLLDVSVDMHQGFVFFQTSSMAPVQLIRVVAADSQTLLIVYTADGKPDDSASAEAVLKAVQTGLS